MDLATITVPWQPDPARYSEIVKEELSQFKVIRWYISSFLNESTALIEAVVEK
jgi:hypothetical protein